MQHLSTQELKEEGERLLNEVCALADRADAINRVHHAIMREIIRREYPKT